MNKFISIMPKPASLFLVLSMLFSCEREKSAFDFYYPRKDYPGSGEATIKGKKLSGRFGFAIERDQTIVGQLSIVGVLPINPEKGGGEWRITFKNVPPKLGRYELTPISNLSENSCYSSYTDSIQVGTRMASAAGDGIGDFYHPYCENGKLLPSLKINKLDTIKGYIEGEFSMRCVNSSNANDFVVVEEGKFSSPVIR